jgi:hypothetical protein
MGTLRGLRDLDRQLDQEDAKFEAELREAVRARR